MSLVERFVFDLGLMLSGESVVVDSYVSPKVAKQLGDAIRPDLVAGLTTRPDFGEYAQVRIEGDLLAPTTVRTVVEFEDRSTRVDRQGRVVARVRRRIRVLLLIDPSITVVMDHRLDIA